MQLHVSFGPTSFVSMQIAIENHIISLQIILLQNCIFSQHMDSLGENLERSNLYLKLFKLVFGSVTLFAQENELMLKVGVYMCS